MSFSELGLAEPIVRAVAAEGYTAPTPIQTKAIPEILAGRDVLGCAQTGTGKTGAFALPILHRFARSLAHTDSRSRRGGHGRKPRAVVLCPTRELATQIFESFKTYGRHLPIQHAVIFGGISQHRQVRDLRAGVDVLVATPGRLLDLMQQGHVDLSAIEVLVLDEADRMLDMGFIRDIRKVVDRLPAERQTLLFSATMPGEIRQLADSILDEPVFVQAAVRMAAPADAIAQTVYLVARSKKASLLERLLRGENMGRTLVFTRTKHGADKLVRSLQRAGLEADAIHGNKNQNARTRALAGFKSGRMPVLIATDIASRGIDVEEITHVVNYDMPNVPETYVHRIGRTARAGASGIALSFCDHEELGDLRAIERLIGIQLAISDNETDMELSASTAVQSRSERESRQPRGAASSIRRRRRPSQGGQSHATAANGSRSYGSTQHRGAAANGRSSKSRPRGARRAAQR